MALDENGNEADPRALGWSPSTDVTGFTPSTIGPFAPGADLDVSQADDERAQQEALIRQLQAQAATGNGSWQESLANAMQMGHGQASSLGTDQASMARTGISGALGNTANAQAGILQRGVNQAGILRQQSQNNAQDALSTLEAAQGQGDIAQAQAQAAARQQVRQANEALGEQSAAARGSILGGAGGALAMLSKGGEVPGTPKVFGDDEKNDTVPARLSPGEIVIPRSAAFDPNKAASFARAVAMKHGVQHMADGGTAGAWRPGDWDISTMSAPGLGMPSTEAPSAQNGGVLDTSQYDAARQQMDALAPQLRARANGSGSIADILAEQQQSQAMAQALAMQNNRRMSAANIIQGAAARSSDIAEGAGKHRQEDQASSQKALGDFATTRRAQELGLANAQQQQEWANTMLNMGINTQNQKAIRDMASGAGQGIAALTSAAHSQNEDRPNWASYDTPTSSYYDTPAGPEYDPAGANPDTEGTEGQGDFTPTEPDAPTYAAFGGRIPQHPVDDEERGMVHQFLRHLSKRATA